MKLDGNNITADEADEADIQGDSVYHVITIYVQQFHKDSALRKERYIPWIISAPVFTFPSHWRQFSVFIFCVGVPRYSFGCSCDGHIGVYIRV